MPNCNHCVHAGSSEAFYKDRASSLVTVHANKQYLTSLITYLPIYSTSHLSVFVPEPSSASSFSPLHSS